MIATHTSMSTLLEPRMMQTRGGKINMCKAIDIWLAEGSESISQVSPRASLRASLRPLSGISQGNDETSYKMLMKIIVSRFGKKAGELASPTIRYLTSDERIDLVETAATTDTFAHFKTPCAALPPKHNDPRNRQRRTNKLPPLKCCFSTPKSPNTSAI